MTKKVIYLFFSLVIVVLLFQSASPTWSNDLQGDIYTFYSRADYFIKNLSLGRIANNEYQPGALLFFAALSPVLAVDNSIATFTKTFIFTNLLLVLLIAYLYHKISSYKSIFLYSLILLCTGPIIFYRFELLVVATIILAFYCWQEKRFKLSSSILAIATLIKIYPIILLPYFLIERYHKSGIRSTFIFLLSYTATIIFVLTLFLFIFRTNFSELTNAFNYHAAKSVSVESSGGTFISIINKATSDAYPPLEGNFKMWAVSRDAIFFPIFFYNYFWILPIAFLYFWFMKFKRNEKELNIKFLILVIFTFFFFSKVQAPQYILWFSLLLPLLEINDILHSRKLLLGLSILLLVFFLTQFIYPLNFTRLIKFYTIGENIGIFWINSIRNLLMLISLLLLSKDLISDYKKKS